MSFQPPNQQNPEQQPGSPFPPTTQMPAGPFGAPGAPTGAPSNPTGAPAGFPPSGFPRSGFAPAAGPPGGPYFNPASGYTPPPPKRGGSLFTILVFLIPLLGLGAGAFIYFSSKNDADDARKQVQEALDGVTIPDITLPGGTDISLPTITLPDNVTPVTVAGVDTTVAQATPTLPDTLPPETVAAQTVPPETVPPATVAPVTNLWTADGSAQVITALETTISGDPSRFLTINIYDTYAVADAQDANAADHVDEYPFRDGVVGESSPVQLVGDGDLEASLFSISDLDMSQIPRLVTEAPGLTKVEEPVVVYVRIERSSFIEGFPVTFKIYVNGPRSSGYVEYDAAGTLIKVVE